MKFSIDDIDYDVIVIKKNNKNTYIRVKNDFKIYVTTNYFVTKKQIEKLLKDNESYLRKVISKIRKKSEKEELFFYLGNSYDIIEVSTMKDISIDYNNKIIYTPNQKKLDKWLKNEIVRIFNERYEYNFSKFLEGVKPPVLKIRTMKSRWGVYNRKNHSITLNSHLIEYTIDKLDYVIFHELCHIKHFDHSKNFWNLVSKYCPDYKKIRNDLKE